MIQKLELNPRSERGDMNKRKQISFAIDPSLVERFNKFADKYEHGTKKMLIELAIRNLLEELENKLD